MGTTARTRTLAADVHPDLRIDLLGRTHVPRTELTRA
jgi:hypothetical protein